MKNRIIIIKKALFEVYNNKKYFLLTFLFALLVFTFNALINNYRYIFSSFSLSLILSLFLGSFSSISKISLFFLITISFLSGIVLSLSIYLGRRQFSSSAIKGGSSLIASIIAPSCPSCALGLLSILGFGSFLAILPFKGLELGFLAILLLIWSILFLSKKVTTNTCMI